VGAWCAGGGLGVGIRVGPERGYEYDGIDKAGGGGCRGGWRGIVNLGS